MNRRLLSLTLLACLVTLAWAREEDEPSLIDLIWDLPFNQAILEEADEYYYGCIRYGIPSPFYPGESTDPWYWSHNCKTYKGSAGCINETYDPELDNIRGDCACNQGLDNAFDAASGACLGKVGAICTVEIPSFIPEKKCFQHADCKPDQDGEGRMVGKCQCVGGYELDPETGKCVEADLEDGEERSTIRVPTTSDPPEREEFELPIGLLLATNYAGINEGCLPGVLLNKTYCNTYGRTVSCLNQQCQCNLPEESLFNPILERCVNLAGSWCLTRPNLLGSKSCTIGATCVPELGRNKTLYSFGICECLPNFHENEDGTCTIIPKVSTTPDPEVTDEDGGGTGTGETRTTPTASTSSTTTGGSTPPSTTAAGTNFSVTSFLLVVSVIASAFKLRNE